MDKIRTLYVSDLDGTLLDADSTISDESARLLDDAIRHRGALFTIATARTPATAAPIMSRLPAAHLPFVVIGGTAWWNPVARDYAYVCPIDAATVEAIDTVMRQHAVRPFIYRRHGNWLHTYHYGPMSDQEKTFVAQRTGLQYKTFHLDRADYLNAADGEQTLFIFSMNRYDRLRVIRDDLNAAGIACQVMLYHDIVDPDNGYLEISAHRCTKASSIALLARELKAERVVVFGDNRNDIAMMRSATVSVAPDNAFDDVKAVADVVIGPNTASSVARWIARDLDVRC
ncbi:MAG: HAD family phosphatase [Muribaculaceae bacterium]|nr:HAD family phosphatase [Muribaculaceae bacterium]